jgi:hypothetical protein
MSEMDEFDFAAFHAEELLNYESELLNYESTDWKEQTRLRKKEAYERAKMFPCPDCQAIIGSPCIHRGSLSLREVKNPHNGRSCLVWAIDSLSKIMTLDEIMIIMNLTQSVSDRLKG